MATPEANRQPIVNGESQINGEFKSNGQSHATGKPIVNRKPLLPYPVGQFVSPSNIFQDCPAKKRSSLCETSSIPRAKRQMTSAPPPSFVNAPINIDRPVLDEELGFLAPYLSDGTRVLHLGCREGDVTKDICEEVSPNGLVYGIDLYPTNIRKANSVAGLTNVIFRRVPDMTVLPFGNDFFDVVYASDLMVYFPTSKTHETVLGVLQEMRRVAKPGGIIASRDITDHHFFPSDDLDNLITRNVFKASGLTNWYGPIMPRLYKRAGFDIQGRGFDLATTSSVRGPAIGDRLWVSRYMNTFAKGSLVRAQWLAAKIPESTIDLILEKLNIWGAKDDSWYLCVYTEIITVKPDESLKDDSETTVGSLDSDASGLPHTVT